MAFIFCYVYFITFIFQAKNISDTLRIIGLTIIRESARGIGENNYELPEIMFSLVIPLVADENYTVRHDSVFTLGNIVFYGKQSVYKLIILKFI